MGCDELIGSLRKEAEAKVREIWSKAEEEAGMIRADLSQRREAMRQENSYGQSSEEVRKIQLDAETRARIIKLESADRLSMRLYSLAISCLVFLREENYGEIFGRLVHELPSCQWLGVRVNPLDSDLAKKYFPEAKITADKDIAGGLAADDGEGKAKVVNTFEKRLEKLWPQILPHLLGDISREIMDNGTPDQS